MIVDSIMKESRIKKIQKEKLVNLIKELKKLEGSEKGKNIRRATKEELNTLARRIFK
jgi:hypothetical protein